LHLRLQEVLHHGVLSVLEEESTQIKIPHLKKGHKNLPFRRSHPHLYVEGEEITAQLLAKGNRDAELGATIVDVGQSLHIARVPEDVDVMNAQDGFLKSFGPLL